MIWFIFALLTAFFASLKDVFSKKGLKKIDEYMTSWSLRFFALIFLAPLLFFIEIPVIGERFWMALFIGGFLSVITTVIFMKAIKKSDLSNTIPMITFTPLFLLLTSPIIVGEFPNFYGLIGVLLIVIGSYILNIGKRKEGYLKPFKALLENEGPRLMLLVAFLWSITSNFDKIGVQNSSPIFWSIAINIFSVLVLLPVVLYKSKDVKKQFLNGYVPLILIGLFSALTLVFQMMAINLTLVAYVISIKRTSAVMGVIFGYFIFKEKQIKERLLGATVMVLGVLFMLIS